MTVTTPVIFHTAHAAYAQYKYLTQVDASDWKEVENIYLSDETPAVETLWMGVTLAVLTTALPLSEAGTLWEQGKNVAPVAYKAYMIGTGQLDATDWDELLFEERTNWYAVAREIIRVFTHTSK